MNKNALVFALSLAFGSAYPASAAPLPVDNPSFETGAPGTYSSFPGTPFAGWLFGCGNANACGASGISAPGFSVPDGTQVGFTSAGRTPGNTSFIGQEIAPIIPGAEYTMTVMLRPGDTFVPGAYRVSLGYDTVPGNVLSNVSFGTFLPNPTPGTFSLVTLTAIAPAIASGNLTIAFGSGALAFWDLATASVVSQVPLPAALPLFATGLGALGFLSWRRKRKAATAA